MILTVLFLIFIYLRPWEHIPALTPLRLVFWTGNIGLAVSICRYAIRGSGLLVRTAETYLLALFACVLVLSPVLAEGWIGGAAEAFTAFMTSLTGCVLILLNVDTIRRLRTIAALLVVLSICLVAQGAWSYHTGWEAERLVMEQRFDQVNEYGVRDAFGRVRALGHLNDPNDFAQALVVAIPLLWPAWRSGRKFRNLILVLIPTAILLYGIFLTRSRGGMLSILCITMLLLRERMTRFRNIMSIGGTAVMGVGMLALGATGGRDLAGDSSSEGRLEAWRAGIQMLISHPLTGVGFGNYSDHHSAAAHNSFVHCFAELGLFGYFTWLGLLVFSITRLTAIAQSVDEDGERTQIAGYASAVRASFCGFLTGAFFLSRTYTPTLYLLIGLTIAVYQISLDTDEVSTGAASRIFAMTTAATFGSVVMVYVASRFG